MCSEQVGDEQDRLRALRALVAEGLDQLDQGQGLELEGTRQISEFVRDLGRRAVARRRRRGS
jgi:hypothetical protein